MYWCAADVGWVTGHSSSYTGRGQWSDVGDVGGCPRLSHKGIWWELIERYKVSISSTARRRDPRVHQGGAQWPEQARSLLAAPARLGGRADQPEGLALVPQGDRRRTLPDRGHLVADRDGRDHDHAAAWHHGHQAGLGDKPFPGVQAQVLRESTGEPLERGPGSAGADAPVAVDAATLYKEDERFISTYFERFGKETYLVGMRAWHAGRLHLGDRTDRRRGQRLRSPALDGRGRVGDRRPSRCGRGRGDRPARRAVWPSDRRLRDAPGGTTTATRRRSRDPRDGGRADRQVRASKADHLGDDCRRRAPARSCAGCCGISPRAVRWAT